MTQFAELAHIMPRGFKIFSGDDGLALAAIAVGAHGLISVASNEAPAEVTRMIRAALDNNWAEARDLERRYCAAFRGELLGVESEPGEDGAEPDGPVRRIRCVCRWCLPLAATRARLERLAGELGLLKHVPIPAGVRSEVF